MEARKVPEPASSGASHPQEHEGMRVRLSNSDAWCYSGRQKVLICQEVPL